MEVTEVRGGAKVEGHACMTSGHVGGPKCRKPDALRRRRGFRGSGRGKGDPQKGGGGKPAKGGGAKAVGAAAVDFLQRGAMGPPSRSLGKRTQREDRQEGGGGGKTRARGSASRDTGQSVATDWEELADAEEEAGEGRVEEDLTHSPA
jgi:hypothetical protein